MKLAAIYARVSTEQQATDGTSLGSQLVTCQEYAAAHDMQVLFEVAEDISGAILARPGLDQIRFAAERGEVQVIICYDPDRLSRSMGHLMLLRDEFEQRRVALIFVNSPNDDTPEGRMMLGMRGVFGEFERDKIRQRTMRGKDSRVRSGKVLAARPRYGYIYNAERTNLIVHEERAEHVRLMFRWLVDEHATLYEIARRLNEAGVPTPTGKGLWQPPTIRLMLLDEIYAGVWSWGKRRSVVPRRAYQPRKGTPGNKGRKGIKASRAPRDPSEWISVPVPAIIERRYYEAASVQLQRNKEMATRNRKHQYLLAGLVFCEYCNQRRVGKHSGGYRKYKCHRTLYRGLAGPGDPKQCNARSVRADVLESLVWDMVIQQIMDTPRVIEDTLEWGEESSRRDTWERLDQERAQISDREQRLASDIQDTLGLYPALVTREELSQRLAALRKKQAGLLKERTALEERQAAMRKSTLSEAELQSKVEDTRETIRRGAQLISEQQRREFVVDWVLGVYVSNDSVTVATPLDPAYTVPLPKPPRNHQNQWTKHRQQEQALLFREADEENEHDPC